MKRYGNLYHRICDIDNIKLAHKNARKGKTFYKEVKIVDNDVDLYCKKIQYMLVKKTFKNSPYTVFIKNDNGKEREIYKLPYYPDRIIHHAILQVLEPIWKRTLITDTYQSIKGRGVHKLVKKIQSTLTKEETIYYLKVDIKKFYPSIDSSILKKIVRNKIKCRDTLWLLDEIIDSHNGIPIGNYISQYFGNLYLSSVDHRMKEEHGIKHYFRYCDDILLLSNSKGKLWKTFEALEKYVKGLKLQIKENYAVGRVDEGLSYVGIKFFGTHSLINKKVKHNISRHEDIKVYNGVFKLFDSYNLKVANYKTRSKR